jgi:putative membrane-bound dehydrogenase-like protein
MIDPSRRQRLRPRLTVLVVLLTSGTAQADDEALIFTPPGFDRPGTPTTALGPEAATLTIRVTDSDANHRPTPCRLNVVGSDGRYYQPAENRLSPYSFTGEWPKTGKGNRTGKAPVRYLGHFFYSNGTVVVRVPPGPTRVEVWKGPEFQPWSVVADVRPGEERTIGIGLRRKAQMAAFGYDSGDPHMHFPRRSDEDDALVFDLLEAEDIRYGALLGYNEPAGPYTGVREKLDSPQLRGLGANSERHQGDYHILSGQEYRSTTYGHLNLFLRDDLVREGEHLNANNWPLYGLVGRETRQRGGFAVHAHGGYAQSIYADFVQGDVDGVELLQFGVYRGIGLDDWYRMLNIGYRFPCLGASDYPACRKLGDCVTYVYQDPTKPRDFAGWLHGAAEGRSFVTTGPLLLLEVEGQGPGAVISKSGPGPHLVRARVRVISPVAQVEHVQVVVNGRVIEDRALPALEARDRWFELSRTVELNESSWVAARAFGKAPGGSPDAEAHTNPVYIHLGGKSPYDRASLDALVGKLDGQMAAHRARDFPEKAKVLDYFQKSRDILLKIRESGGLPTGGVPAEWLKDDALAFDPSRREHTDEELAAFLKPLPARTPAEALHTFEAVGGFRMELVVAEPLVHSPVAAAFDEDGDLYVAEMIDYPFKPRPGGKPLGAVRLLRDLDGDGRFDESHVFADGLLWPAGIAPWKGGVFVAAPPDIWYLKDTDGDHRADVRRKVFTGFGTENEQGVLNNLTFGLDHKVYGSTSTNGGSVRAADRPGSPAVSVRGNDFRFDPVTEAFEPVTGTVQFGTTFDDFGERFLCSESLPLMHAVLPREALARNAYLPIVSGLQSVAGNPVPVFRISPLERWRQIRSSRRIAHGERSAGSAGASHHVVDAAAGVTIYRGSAYPPEFYGNAFVGDAQNNLIHRMRLVPAGPTFKAVRADAGTEFVRSYDNWFRPVNLINAPDGTLYVLDMSREVIEAVHIPLDVVKHLDLRRGRDQGRIYRVAPPDFKRPPTPRLGSATTAQLVEALWSNDSWRRDTAHRLIFERQDPAAVAPLRGLLGRWTNPATRALALWSLRGLNALTDEDLLARLDDPDSRVIEHAVRLAEPRLGRSPELLTAVIDRADDVRPRVRFAVALALGATRDPRATEALARIARVDAADRWTRLAVLCSAAEVSHRLFADLVADQAFAATEAGASVLEALAGVVGARNRPDEVGRVLDALAEARGDRVLNQRRLAIGLGQGLRRAGARFDVSGRSGPFVAAVIHNAAVEALDESATHGQRLQAIALLGCAPLSRSMASFEDLLQAQRTGTIQAAALHALADYEEPTVSGLILNVYRGLTPLARTEALTTLLARGPWTLALLKAAEDGRVDLAPVEPARRALLLSHKNPEIAAKARALFSASPVIGTDPVARVAPALTLAGDASRGTVLFDRHCLTCHKLGDRGHAVGPDLTASQFRDASALLTHVVDPNRFVAPNYVQYVLSDKSGRVYTGLIASETASSVTLRRAEGFEDTILRGQIDELSATGKSLMPEDFGSKLTQQEMADLVAFLLKSQAGKPVEERLDIGTLPGLIEPEK